MGEKQGKMEEMNERGRGTLEERGKRLGGGEGERVCSCFLYRIALSWTHLVSVARCVAMAMTPLKRSWR
jgi:hypothetical protein